MENSENNVITVQTTVNAPLDKVWDFFTKPEHIIKWSFASDDWYSPEAENDLRVGGMFKTKMAAKDASVSFDFVGTYTDVQDHALIAYKIADGRKVNISFKSSGDITNVVETFEPETTNPAEMQQGGWQAILDNFKNMQKALSNNAASTTRWLRYK